MPVTFPPEIVAVPVAVTPLGGAEKVTVGALVHLAVLNDALVVAEKAVMEDGIVSPEERASLCSQDYNRVKGAWQQLLGPYLKPAQSRPKLKLRS